MDVPGSGDGHGHPLCAAVRGATTCRRRAGWGTDHVGIGRCRLHGGSTPTQRRHVELVKAREAVAAFGLRRDIGPEQALLEGVQFGAGDVDVLRARLADIDLSAMTEADRATITVYGEFMDRLIRVSKASIDADVSQRAVRLEEAKAVLLVGALQQLVTVLGLSDGQRAVWQVEVPRMLRSLEGTG